jgi:arylsulfatase
VFEQRFIGTTPTGRNNMGKSAQERKPNVVFILVDNIGWGDFGVCGGTIPTPRIDTLASEGIRFNNYNVEVQCTPTRSAIMTGRHPVRSGTFKVPFPGEGLSGMAPWEYTLAELLSDAGYATALYGKWHLGDHQGRLPNDQGFDEWWGVMNSLDEAGCCSRKAACRCR